MHPFAPPAFSSDGARAYFQAWSDDSHVLHVMNIPGGTSANSLQYPTDQFIPTSSQENASIGRMVVVSADTLRIADLDSNRWVGRMDVPKDCGGGKMYLSANGEFCAIERMMFGEVPTPTEILIFDLRPAVKE